ncbi:MAG: hypothetical protein GY870_12665 [archaeon]|nr:hypothetical protein [archaeon]
MPEYKEVTDWFCSFENNPSSNKPVIACKIIEVNDHYTHKDINSVIIHPDIKTHISAYIATTWGYKLSPEWSVPYREELGECELFNIKVEPDKYGRVEFKVSCEQQHPDPNEEEEYNVPAWVKETNKKREEKLQEIVDDKKEEPRVKSKVEQRREIWNRWKHLSKQGVSQKRLDEIIKELDDI